MTDSGYSETETFFWDTITGAPCPRKGPVLCAISDPGHRHAHSSDGSRPSMAWVKPVVEAGSPTFLLSEEEKREFDLVMKANPNNHDPIYDWIEKKASRSYSNGLRDGRE